MAEQEKRTFKIGCGAFGPAAGLLALGLVLGWSAFCDGVVRIIEAWHGR